MHNSRILEEAHLSGIQFVFNIFDHTCAFFKSGNIILHHRCQTTSTKCRALLAESSVHDTGATFSLHCVDFFFFFGALCTAQKLHIQIQTLLKMMQGKYSAPLQIINKK